MFCQAAERGVVVKGLLWRSHLDGLAFSADENRHLGSDVNEAGGEVLLDQRVRPFGSHHQKLVVARSGTLDVAFAGGIDLCHSRRDDADHGGDPQGLRMSDEYGDTPPWHDVQVEVRGPAVGDLEAVFRERWDDPSPLDNRVRMAVERRLVKGIDTDASELPEQTPDPDAGRHLRRCRSCAPTRPAAAGPGTRSRPAASAAWPPPTARCCSAPGASSTWRTSTCGRRRSPTCSPRRSRAGPSCTWSASCPRFPDQGGKVGRPPSLVGRQDALDVVLRAGGDRVSVFDLENHAGTPVYVHAKVCVVDDVWASVGSDNLNMRSWTHDSELSCAVLDDERDPREPRDPGGLGDGARRFARDLRLELWREHLDVDSDDGLVDPTTGLARLRATAQALDAWHDGGRQGPRPPGPAPQPPGRPPARRAPGPGRARCTTWSSTRTGARAPG